MDRVLTDYTTIWGRLESQQEMPPTDASEVAEWISLFQQGGDAAGRWRAKRSLPWLVAALVHTASGDPSMRDLLDAARQVAPDSPAYATVSYYGVLQQIRSGDRGAAREWAEQVLMGKQQDSVTNMLRAERLSLARDWADFLRFAPRKPVLLVFDYASDFGSPGEALKKKAAAFDADSVRPLNQTTPLKLWIDAAQSKLVPRRLQAEIAQAGWVRAVILDDGQAANRLARRLRQLEPGLAVELDAYVAASDPAVAKFTAVFMMLRAPGLTPILRPGLGRETPALKRDTFRDNWWRLTGPPQADAGRNAAHEALYDLYPDGNWGPPDFLPASERTAGQQQWARLVQRADNAVNYLCAEAIAWARTHPQDPRVPRALHLAVEATHYGPADRATGAYSHQAFDLLHARYPDSEWAAKTKYWY